MASKCGAKTRASGRCRQPAMPNGRCHFHGGKSTGPKNQTGNQNATQHGIYARHMTEAERADFASLEMGTVDNELRLTRIQLSRALAAQAAARGKPELDEIVTRDALSITVPRSEKTSRVRDYVAIIDKLTARIESLEKTRLVLRAEVPPDPNDLDADKLTPGVPDEPAPEKPIR